MHSRVVVALTVAALVAAAGCNGLGTPQSGRSAETLTPAPVPDAAGPGGTTPPPSRPAWVDADGNLDVNSLVRAHEGALGRQSYAWHLRYATRREGSVDSERRYAVRARVDGERLLLDQVSDGSLSNRTLYVADGVGYLRGADGGVERLDQPPRRPTETLGSDVLYRYLDGVTVDVATVRRGSETFLRLQSAPGEVPVGLRGFGSSVWNYSATAYVTPGGFVRTLAVEYGWTRGREEREASLRYDYADLGTATVERPEWVRRATTTPATGTTYQPTTVRPPGTPTTPAAAPTAVSTVTPATGTNPSPSGSVRSVRDSLGS